MFDITLSGFVRFITQFGFAVSGAVSLWGYIFLVRSRAHPDGPWIQYARLLIRLYIPAVLVFFLAWWTAALVYYPLRTFAHEGIMLQPFRDHIEWGFQINMPMVITLMAVTVAHIMLFFGSKQLWQRRGSVLYLMQFFLFSGISFFSVYTDTWGADRVFFAFHNWHSILTLGTVAVVDFLFLIAARVHGQRLLLYKFFPAMSKVIWVGLGVDFLSNMLIFERAFHVDAQFLFIQTVIAVIIINGTLLSGRINKALIRDAESNERLNLTSLFRRLVSLSGATSIVSWLTITFADFFTFTASYIQMFSVYLALIAVAFFLHHTMQKLTHARFVPV